MAIVLLRLDERLIHGQVVVGWGSQLRPDRFLIVDDALAESQWEQELYALGAGGAVTLFLGVDEARCRLAEWRADGTRSILLVRDVATLARLGEGGALQGSCVNLGGVHHGPGRREVLGYLHLSPDEESELAALEESGAQVSAQDLPSTPRVPLGTLLRG